MRTLILMRHGKSSFKDPSLKDRRRPLTKRGQRNSIQIGQFLKERNLHPDLILTSEALRATQTADLITRELDYPGEVRQVKKLYMAEGDQILKVLRKLPDELECVMVIGHNPGLESLIPMLTQQIAGLPTAGVADIRLPIDHWKELKPKTKGELVDLWRPKELEAEDEIGPQI